MPFHWSSLWQRICSIYFSNIPIVLPRTCVFTEYWWFITSNGYSRLVWRTYWNGIAYTLVNACVLHGVTVCTIVCLFDVWYLHFSATSRLPDVMVKKTTKGFSVIQCNLREWVGVWKLISMFVTRLTRRVPLVELLTLPEHLSSPLVFSGVRVTWSLVLYVCFVDRCLSFCLFSFGHYVVCSSSIYGFWLPPFGIFKLFLQLIRLNLFVFTIILNHATK